MLGDGIENDNSVREQVFADFPDDLIHVTAMPADEYGVGDGKVVQFSLQKVSDAGDDAGRSETGGVDFHEAFALGALLESHDVQVRELEFRLDGDGTGAEPDVP